MSEIPEMPPKIIAQYDQLRAANAELVNKMIQQYREWASELGDIDAEKLFVGSLINGFSGEPLVAIATILGTAIKRLAAHE